MNTQNLQNNLSINKNDYLIPLHLNTLLLTLLKIIKKIKAVQEKIILVKISISQMINPNKYPSHHKKINKKIL
jgi:hypothetical protein